eukprot:CAMPEP_0171106948 /NCGR_PEP_ID=MMETSP0766_2-20121228/65856_1 /TAXON_ID=439317 /ORGANISM="Gambierdiscus australes, Strain CAWD 149" /LENGTH=69 /DNA_ID=CAMNT_0011568163 /DNA_START=564 /DNA_END=769 /DNA_ORIENTATION=-
MTLTPLLNCSMSVARTSGPSSGSGSCPPMCRLELAAGLCKTCGRRDAAIGASAGRMSTAANFECGRLGL